jgi:hypothetical protein
VPAPRRENPGRHHSDARARRDVARGLVSRDAWMVAFGLAVQSAGKTWFIDRMALVHGHVAPAGAVGTALHRDRRAG